MIYLVIGIALFLGIHSVRVFFDDWRTTIIGRIGVGPWRGIYSVVSLLGLAAIVWGYGEARADNINFYSPPTWLYHLQTLLMLPAMMLMVASSSPPGNIKRIVKNPLLIGTKLWAIGHLLVNGDLASWLLFGAFLVWAVFLTIQTNRRNDPVPDRFETKGDVVAVIAGTVLWAVIVFWLHEWFIGVPVFA